MFKSSLKYLSVSLAPVVLAWGLGYLKVPESTAYLDYTVTTSELLQIDTSLRKDMSITVGENDVSELFLYSLHFINESGKNFSKTKISFQVENSDASQLISTSFKGPKNYSPSLISEIPTKNKDQVSYELELINIASESNSNYFTANFLFAGELPISVLPTSHSVGTEFRPHANTDEKWLTRFGATIAVLLYAAFFWWMNKKMDAKYDEKKNVFKKNMTVWFNEKLELSDEKAKEYADQVEKERTNAFVSPSWMKKKLQAILRD
ncbi:hypothetical protein K6U52_05845 [Vibrio vulnificus]|uniref:hypothetical protein n=1 Tax=Vibrio vulnificus TaxID=672 RepID=UPI001EEB699E|nr:hypothetical protein [Vibrio vulnificus]MCG6312814.1 hypothetical protein [Vibrio vulnificus]